MERRKNNKTNNRKPIRFKLPSKQTRNDNNQQLNILEKNFYINLALDSAVL